MHHTSNIYKTCTIELVIYPGEEDLILKSMNNFKLKIKMLQLLIYDLYWIYIPIEISNALVKHQISL